MKYIRIYDVRVHPGDSAFLIDDGKTSILYDSGFAFTGYGVAEKVGQVLGDRKLDFIFLTHSHYDHALGSVYALEKWPDAKVVAGEYAAKIFAKPTAKAVMRDLDRRFADTCGIGEYEDLIDNLRVDIPACDGDIIQAGDMQFKVINLPGHTKCSVGYYCAAEKLLLGSETVGVFNGEDDVIPSYLVGYQMAMDSIARLRSFDIENVLVPHFGLLDKDKTKIYFERAAESNKNITEDIVKMLKDGKSKEEISLYYEQKYYHGYIKKIYPIDAMRLNTGIMINLIEKEFGPKEQ